MSRIGNRLLTIPDGVTVDIQPSQVVIQGKTGHLVVDYPADHLEIRQDGQNLHIVRRNETAESNMYQGTVNANIHNALVGLTTGFQKHLELKGVGYRAKTEGNNIVLGLGFSHPVLVPIPEGIKIEHPTQNEIVIKGADKAVVGQLAADIRAYRKPEPYKGKGVLYKGEQVVRKVGKTADKKK